MKYPCNYDLLREEEMVYIAGGSALDAFNYLFGDWFRDMLLSDIRNATWGSMQQLNVQPVVDTGKKDRQLGLACTAGLWVRFLPSGADRKELSDPVK